MSVQQIMKSAAIICTVPDERKAAAVANATQGAVTAEVPASILQEHGNCHLTWTLLRPHNYPHERI